MCVCFFVQPKDFTVHKCPEMESVGEEELKSSARKLNQQEQAGMDGKGSLDGMEGGMEDGMEDGKEAGKSKRKFKRASFSGVEHDKSRIVFAYRETAGGA